MSYYSKEVVGKDYHVDHVDVVKKLGQGEKTALPLFILKRDRNMISAKKISEPWPPSLAGRNRSWRITQERTRHNEVIFFIQLEICPRGKSNPGAKYANRKF